MGAYLKVGEWTVASWELGRSLPSEPAFLWIKTRADLPEQLTYAACKAAFDKAKKKRRAE